MCLWLFFLILQSLWGSKMEKDTESHVHSKGTGKHFTTSGVWQLLKGMLRRSFWMRYPLPAGYQWPWVCPSIPHIYHKYSPTSLQTTSFLSSTERKKIKTSHGYAVYGTYGTSNLGCLSTLCISKTPSLPTIRSQFRGRETGLGRTWKKRPVLSSLLSLLWNSSGFTH